MPQGAYSVAIAELDGDRYGDVVTAPGNGAPGGGVGLRAGSASGALGALTGIDLPGGFSLGVAVGDVTGDGKPDIVTGRAGAFTIIPGDGRGGLGTPFSAPIDANPSGAVYDVALGWSRKLGQPKGSLVGEAASRRERRWPA